MEADPGNAAGYPVAPTVTQKEWFSSTVATLDHTKDRAKQVMDALKALEKQEADRLAARQAERRRLEAEAEAKRHREREQMVADRDKRFQEVKAEELRQQQENLNRSKRQEAAALKAATASFLKEKATRQDSKEKERVMSALSDTSQKILNGVLECQHTNSKLWGIMMLCEQRQRLRQDRPQTELFRDQVDQALEREWQMLTAARVELNDLTVSGEALRKKLEVLHVQLNTEQSRETALRRIMKSHSAPQLPSGQTPQANGSSTKEIIKKAIALVDEATAHPRLAYAIVSKVNSLSDLMTNEVHASLERRRAEVGELIRGLHDRKEEAVATIGDAEKRIGRLRRRALTTIETPRSRQASDEQLSSAEALLVDLRSLKQGLETDLRNKNSALQIDSAARQLTKVRTGGSVTKRGQNMRKTANDGGFMRKTLRDKDRMEALDTKGWDASRAVTPKATTMAVTEKGSSPTPVDKATSTGLLDNPSAS